MAVLLFARIDVLGVAWLRIATAAVVFGVLVHTQIPSVKEIIGVVLVVAGVALHQERPLDEPAQSEQPDPATSQQHA